MWLKMCLLWLQFPINSRRYLLRVIRKVLTYKAKYLFLLLVPMKLPTLTKMTVPYGLPHRITASYVSYTHC
jgi:hypothetical protein